MSSIAKRIAVTGTDTGVGKTVVAAALVATLRARGVRVTAFKPVETGIVPGDGGSDGAFLRAAAGGADPEALVRPIALPAPLAPWLAAREAGTPIELSALDAALGALGRGRDAVVIEGAGGLLVPIAPGVRYDTLFARWGADVVVVAHDRLGVINHTLLTVEAARRAGLRVLGVVLNAGPGPAATGDVSRRSNRAALAELLPELPVLPFPRVPDPRDLTALAAAGEECGIAGLVEVSDPKQGRGQG